MKNFGKFVIGAGLLGIMSAVGVTSLDAHSIRDERCARWEKVRNPKVNWVTDWKRDTLTCVARTGAVGPSVTVRTFNTVQETVQKGNNGFGNGIDGQPPGNPKPNDN